MPDVRSPEQTARIFHALSHPIRVELLFEYAEGKCVSPTETTVARRLGDHKLGVVSYHVRLLHRARMLRGAGRIPVRGAVKHRYRITDDGKAAVELARQLNP